MVGLVTFHVKAKILTNKEQCNICPRLFLCIFLFNPQTSASLKFVLSYCIAGNYLQGFIFALFTL